jgi:spore coat protein U-like protein
MLNLKKIVRRMTVVKRKKNAFQRLSFLFFLWFAFCLCISQCEAGVSCTFIFPTLINFGNYNPTSPVAATATGTIQFHCTGSNRGGTGQQIQITLNPGVNSGGSFNPRDMMGPAPTDLLAYNLYLDSTDTTIWGDGTQGTSVYTYNYTPGNTGNITATIYGQLFPLQNVPASPSPYTDSITVTATY